VGLHAGGVALAGTSELIECGAALPRVGAGPGAVVRGLGGGGASGRAVGAGRLAVGLLKVGRFGTLLAESGCSSFAAYALRKRVMTQKTLLLVCSPIRTYPEAGV